MYHFFKPHLNELNTIITKRLADNKEQMCSANVLQTGWTNITMDVVGSKDEYIFRFPRNLFFANAMIKDCAVCSFLKDKISFPVPHMSLMMDANRPFSVHSKIKGTTLDKLLPDLTLSDKTAIADDLAKFLVELQSLPLQDVPPLMKKKLNTFLLELAEVHQGDYDFSQHALWNATEESAPQLCLTHGDFHPGNILIGQNNRVVGIIDFAFTTISDRHADLGRFVCRSDPQMSQLLINAYQQRSKQPCESEKINQMATLFHYVDTQYVKYMQRAHPEIIIPKMLLDKTK